LAQRYAPVQISLSVAILTRDVGPIEKGASDGQLTYSTAIANALRTAVSAKPSLLKPPIGKSSNGKLRKKSKANAGDSTPTPPSPDPTAVAQTAKKDGLLEPVRGLLPDMVVDVLEMLFTTQSIMALLTILLVYSWFFRSASSGAVAFGQTPQRAVAYEEIWRTEESELWKWLEERVALDRVHDAVSGSGYQWQQTRNLKQKLGKGGVAEGIKEQQIDEAIRVTEERLAALKGAVINKRGAAKGVESVQEK
jgi:hypothetical protein